MKVRPDNWLVKKLRSVELLDVGLGILAIWLLLGWVTIRLDPFGLGRVSDYHSERIIDRITSPFYESKGQDEIAVVLIDEDTLAAEEIGWPPSYDYYSQTIYRIMRHDPKAIFVDILLESERPAAIESLPLAREDLADYIEEFRIPVVFAQSEPGAKNLFGDIPGVTTALSGWHGSDYPLMISPEHKNPADDDSGDRTGHPTAAMQLYTITHPSSPIAASAPANLVTQWGCAAPALAKENDLLPGLTYDFVNPTFTEKWLMSTKLLFHSIMIGWDENAVDKNRQQCPYTLTVQAHQLADHKGILKDRIVLVGVKVSGIHDIVETPVHGQLPGVYKHAMALDNLIKYDDSYYTRPPFNAPIYICLAIFMSFFSAWLMGMRVKKRVLVSSTFSIVVTVCMVLYFKFNFAPQNWIGLALICTLANGFQSRDKAYIVEKQSPEEDR